MRRLIIQVAQGCGAKVAEIARECGSRDAVVTPSSSSDGPREVVTFSVGNSRIETVLERLGEVPDPHVSFDPRGIIALRPPPGEAAAQVVDVQPRSPIEVYLSGLQSVGSWTAFLGYAAAAGVIAWIALFTERIFLLVAAMLIAPFAGPAMNAALATARGDVDLFWRSLLRYGLALAVSVAAAFLLSVAMQQQIATGLMVQESMISSVAVLLPLVAGAAGALNLCQSDRNSLVSGAATGMLIASSLAPPAGIAGMAAAIGEWPMVMSGLFLLLLQIAGINLAGAAVFRFYRISPGGVRLDRGERQLPMILGAASLAFLALLVAWQMKTAPNLQRSSIAQRAAQNARQLIDNSGVGKAIKVDAQFTRANIRGQNTLLVTGYVQSPASDREEAKARLEHAIKAKLKRDYEVDPVTDITVVEP